MRYFVSYAYYEKGNPYFGNAEWEGDQITSLEQIQAIEEDIRQQVRDEEIFVKILFWQPFE